MNERFNYCFEKVLSAEGGFVDLKADKGGRTNYGVTQKTLDNFCYEQHQPSYDVKDITLDTVKQIYFQYWKDAKCDELNPMLDLLVFDCAVNSGAKRAIKLLQLTVGSDDDGVFGKKTKEAVDNHLADYGLKQTCFDYLRMREAFYRQIVERDHSQTVFLKGWYNRLTKLEKFVDNVVD